MTEQVKNIAMDDLISRSAFKEDIQCITNDSTCPLHIAAELDQYIDLAPTVEAISVNLLKELEKDSTNIVLSKAAHILLHWYTWKLKKQIDGRD